MYNKENISIGVIILAAGLSSRMNIHKPFLNYDNEKLFINKIIEEYINFKCKKIIVVINNRFQEWYLIKNQYANIKNIDFVVNEYPERERFYSVKLGLSALDDIDFCFIQNVDNPFVDYSILSKLFNSVTNSAYCVPVFYNKGGHPILINKKIQIELIKQDNNSNLKEALKPFERINVEFDTDKILVNVNTKEDYLELFQLI